MARFVLEQPGDVLSAVYDLELTEQAWITQITRGIGTFIDGGRGTLGCVFRMDRGLQMHVLSPVRADDEVPDLFQYLQATRDASEGFFQESSASGFGSLFAASGMGTLSVDRAFTPAYEIFRREFEATGVRDAAGLIVPHTSSGSFIFFTARQTETSGVPLRAKSRWIELQQHIAAVYDLRTGLDAGTFCETDAVWFNTSGDCVEAGPARRDDIRDRLREAVRQRESNRLGDSSSKRADLQRYWANVASGKWAILDRFDSDGRRFVIALPISKYANALRGMTKRERQIFEALARGPSNKEIAWELGISQSAVSSHINHIYQKLEIADRSMAVRIAQMMHQQLGPNT